MSNADVPPSSRPELVEILERLRAVMAEERRAIARLDLPVLESLTARKRSLCDELAATAADAGAPGDRGNEDRGLRRLVARTRFELGASAALIAAASEAIAAALGEERDDRYDRSARRHVATRPIRVLAL